MSATEETHNKYKFYDLYMKSDEWKARLSFDDSKYQSRDKLSVISPWSSFRALDDDKHDNDKERRGRIVGGTCESNYPVVPDSITLLLSAPQLGGWRKNLNSQLCCINGGGVQLLEKKRDNLPNMKYFGNNSSSWRDLALCDCLVISLRWEFKASESRGSQLSKFRLTSPPLTPDRHARQFEIWRLEFVTKCFRVLGGKRHCWRGGIDLGFKHTVHTK